MRPWRRAPPSIGSVSRDRLASSVAEVCQRVPGRVVRDLEGGVSRGHEVRCAAIMSPQGRDRLASGFAEVCQRVPGLDESPGPRAPRTPLHRRTDPDGRKASSTAALSRAQMPFSLFSRASAWRASGAFRPRQPAGASALLEETGRCARLYGSRERGEIPRGSLYKMGAHRVRRGTGRFVGCVPS